MPTCTEVHKITSTNIVLERLANSATLVCAAAALHRRDVFEATEGFAESFFCYQEDIDLGFRLNLFGYEAIQLGARSARWFGLLRRQDEPLRHVPWHPQ
jgi:GT2 family glycosyltransferase